MLHTREREREREGEREKNFLCVSVLCMGVVCVCMCVHACVCAYERARSYTFLFTDCQCFVVLFSVPFFAMGLGQYSGEHSWHLIGLDLVICVFLSKPSNGCIYILVVTSNPWGTWWLNW